MITEIEKIKVLLEEAKKSLDIKYPNLPLEEMPTEMYYIINALSKVKKLALSGVSQPRELLREYNNFNNKEMIYGGKLTDFEIDCFMDSRNSG